MNPYFGADLLTFFPLFFSRLARFITGDLPLSEAAPDEVQIAVLVLVALSCACIGVFLVLTKMTMLANALSHTILPGLVIAYLMSVALLSSLDLQALLWASLITGLLTVSATQLSTYLFKLQEDASIGLVSTTMVAIGVILVTLFTRSTHLGVEAVMGNVDALHPSDVRLVLGIFCIIAPLIALFFKEFKIIAFDSPFARTQGFSPQLWRYILMFLTAMTVIGAFRAVGILLVLSLLVGPVLTARLFTHRLKFLILAAAALGSGASCLSVALCRHCLSVYHTPLSTAGILSTLLSLIYALSLLFVFVTRENRLYKNRGV